MLSSGSLQITIAIIITTTVIIVITQPQIYASAESAGVEGLHLPRQVRRLVLHIG